MRVKYPSIADAANQILKEIEAENLVKTAEQQVLNGALYPKVNTETAHDLMKLAEHCRKINIRSPEITYNDLQEFMVTCNAK